MPWLTRAAGILGALLAWSWTELCGRLPEALRRLGPRARMAVAELDTAGRWRWTGQVETSWFGAGTFRRGGVPDEPHRAVLVLPESGQFRTRIRLGAQACRRGEAAIDLRRGQFTPIPVEAASHASEFVEPVAGGGAEIDIAVIRTSTLESALAAAPASVRDVRVVGALDADGLPRFVFDRTGDAATRWALPVAAAFLALLLAASMWSARLAREEAGLDARRAGLMIEARELRELDEALTWAETVRADASGVSLAMVMRGLAGLPDALPSDVVVERFRLEAGTRLALQTALATHDAVDVQTILIEFDEGVE